MQKSDTLQHDQGHMSCNVTRRYCARRAGPASSRPMPVRSGSRLASVGARTRLALRSTRWSMVQRRTRLRSKPLPQQRARHLHSIAQSRRLKPDTWLTAVGRGEYRGLPGTYLVRFLRILLVLQGTDSASNQLDGLSVLWQRRHGYATEPLFLEQPIELDKIDSDPTGSSLPRCAVAQELCCGGSTGPAVLVGAASWPGPGPPRASASGPPADGA
jgi:hypothetical protein